MAGSETESWYRHKWWYKNLLQWEIPGFHC